MEEAPWTTRDSFSGFLFSDDLSRRARRVRTSRRRADNGNGTQAGVKGARRSAARPIDFTVTRPVLFLMWGRYVHSTRGCDACCIRLSFPRMLSKLSVFFSLLAAFYVCLTVATYSFSVCAKCIVVDDCASMPLSSGRFQWIGCNYDRISFQSRSVDLTPS